MNLESTLPTLLGLAWLLPLASFVLIVFFGRRMGHGGHGAGYVATGAIVSAFVLSISALVCWLRVHPLAGHGEGEAIEAICNNWYTLGTFGHSSLTIGYYIDALTIAMFCMVTLVASCIHIYSFGYMHEELHEVSDPLARLSNGQPLRRRGRFHRFYQFLSLFCFSMLGLVISGNLAMVFAFWELVGICSYFLIGFYIERKSASRAANKAFIVNRVGDFGMIIGLMAIWSSLGTFTFGDIKLPGKDVERGIFSLVRPPENSHLPQVPEGMVKAVSGKEIAEVYKSVYEITPKKKELNQQIGELVRTRRQEGFGYGLLIVAGLGIFCGCVGKSAQFPLHVWLPDAMEGPTPVSALIHAATMVAAGVYLVGRFYPAFVPEVLLVIAWVGMATLFIAATIAITATDIKRVLAYSTVSQLGYMMLALGVGGWLAGIFHLFTHAFFKALLFLGSGSVIHACGTNEMPQMGGLRKKMPWTAYTMLVGCLAIAGAGVPLMFGLSGFHSKDMIIAQALRFKEANPLHAYFFYVATIGAAITAFYMFRLWYLTFAGRPRDEHIFHHAHESPRTMVAPLVILAVLAIVAGWRLFGLLPLLEQARPAGIAEGASHGWTDPKVSLPAEEPKHSDAELVHQDHAIHTAAGLWAFGAALAGFLLSTIMYGWRYLDPEDVRRYFAPLHRFLLKKWYFDELYQLIFVRPVMIVSRAVAGFDRRGIDGLVHLAARAVRIVSQFDEWFDRLFVDGLVNLVARWTHATGVWLRRFQTGSLRQYVMLLAVGTVALFLITNFCWSWMTAGM